MRKHTHQVLLFFRLPSPELSVHFSSSFFFFFFITVLIIITVILLTSWIQISLYQANYANVENNIPICLVANDSLWQTTTELSR